MISRFVASILLMTFSIASNADVQADATYNAVLYKDIPLGMYLLIIGFCAFVFLRKAISTSKEAGVNNSQLLTSKLHINPTHKSIT